MDKKAIIKDLALTQRIGHHHALGTAITLQQLLKLAKMVSLSMFLTVVTIH